MNRPHPCPYPHPCPHPPQVPSRAEGMEKTLTRTMFGTISSVRSHMGIHREVLSVIPLLCFEPPDASHHDKTLLVTPLFPPSQVLAAEPVSATSQPAAKARHCATAQH